MRTHRSLPGDEVIDPGALLVIDQHRLASTGAGLGKKCDDVWDVGLRVYYPPDTPRRFRVNDRLY